MYNYANIRKEMKAVPLAAGGRSLRAGALYRSTRMPRGEQALPMPFGHSCARLSGIALYFLYELVYDKKQ